MEFMEIAKYTILIGMGIIALGILARTSGMWALLEKAVSMVMQQICSLALTVIFLAFKIFNALELYIVLLIDVLTGKRAAVNKVSALAISALSIASYYTTYSGMVKLAGKGVAVLVTIGVQTFLLVASLQIGLELNLDKAETGARGGFGHIKKWLSVFIVIIAGIIVIPIIFSVFRDSNKDFKNIIHAIGKNDGLVNTIYILGIILVLLGFAIAINGIINRKSEKKLKTKILVVLYFATLTFSSFFSYNSFMNILYKDDVRRLDAFLKSKTSVIEAIDTIKDSLDDDAYDTINKNIVDEIDSIEETLETGKEDYRAYKKYKKKIKQLRKDIQSEKKEYTKNLRGFLKNKGNDFGFESGKQTKQMKKEKDKEVRSLRKKIKTTKTKLKNNTFYKKSGTDKTNYKSKLKKLNQIKGDGKNGTVSNSASIVELLQKGEWTETQKQQFNAKIEILIELIGDNNINKAQGTNVITVNDATALAEYKYFLKVHREKYDKILEIDFSEKLSKKAYKNKVNELFESARSVVNAFPNYEAGEKMLGESTTNKDTKTDGVIQIEKAFRASSQDTSDLEKNIKAFLESKVLGMLCAIIAILVDCLILFVGLLTPRPIQYFETKTSISEKNKAILEHLLNKPIS